MQKNANLFHIGAVNYEGTTEHCLWATYAGET